MTPRHAFISMLHLFIVFIFFGFGAFLLSVPHLPELRYKLIDLFSNRFDECSFLGLGVAFISTLLFLSFFFLHRGRYLVIKMGVKTDFSIIRHSIEECFSHQFSKKISLKELEIGPKNLLQIQVSLAPLEETSREELFVLAEKHLQALLRNRFGYVKPFHLVVKI